MPQAFDWINPPPTWSGEAAALEFETGLETDYWTEAFYGFTHDNGHAWVAPAAGEFTLSAEVFGAYEANYDQAGLMMFGAGGAWVKAGIEFTGGAMHFSVVVSTPRSDWSIVALPGAGAQTALAVRLTRYSESIAVQYALDGGALRLARVASFPEGPVRAGVMACSPSRAGFRARFRDIRFGPAVPRSDLGA